MPAALSIDFVLLHWQYVTIPLIGASSAGLTLLLGRHLFHRARKPTLPRQENASTDPYLYGSGTALEKRFTVRRSGKLIKVLVSDEEAKAEPFDSWILDRSMGGICLIMSKLVREATVLSVRTATAPPDSPWVQVQVLRTQAEGPNWEVACKFVGTPPWGVLVQFG